MLTDVAIRSFPVPVKGVKRYWDKNGLCIQISQGGTRTFYFVHGEGRTFLKLGRYPEPLSLAQAREKVRTIIAKKTLGITDETDNTRLQDAVDAYLAAVGPANKPRTFAEKKRVLAYLKPLGRRRLCEVTTRELQSLIEHATKSQSERYHIYAAARAFLRWCVRERILKHSPLQDAHPPAKKSESRDHLITDAEMRTIYRTALALHDIGDPYGSISLIAIHTGLRRGEVGALCWSYISDDTITLPPSLTKNGEKLVLPNLLANILAPLPRSTEIVPDDDGNPVERPCDLLFPSSAGTPYSTWSDGKQALDAHLQDVRPFVFHDFRRYVSSTMAKLGVRIDVTEAILNHVSGSRSPIQRVYDRHDRLPEMRAALTLYEKHLSAIVSS